MFSKGSTSYTLEEFKSKISDADLVSHYLGVSKIPSVICSPLRVDTKTSLGLYTRDGRNIYWVDFATNERGSIFNLLSKMWGCSFKEAMERILKENMTAMSASLRTSNLSKIYRFIDVLKIVLKCRVREWRDYDIE